MTPTLLIFILRFIGPIIGGCLAMITDVREQRIPNKLCVALLVVGLLFRVSTGGLYGFLDALGGAATGFGILFVLHVIGGGGAGDVKFMTAVGSWIGPYHIIFVFVLSAILLAGFTLSLLVVKLLRGESMRTQDSQINDKQDKVRQVKGGQVNPLRARIPYAVPATLAVALRLAWLLLIGRDN